MSILEAIILGIVQGITEFLPVSSSGHLILAQLLFGYDNLDHYLFFDLVCHLGTLLAVIFFYFQPLRLILLYDRQRVFQVILGTLPLVPLVFILKPLSKLFDQPEILGFFFLTTALLLFLGIRLAPKSDPITPTPKPYRDALKIGLFQALAVIPGISRSGATISGARMIQWGYQEAILFSFLLAIPAILGGAAQEALKLWKATGPLPAVPLISYFMGFTISFFVGFASLNLLIRLATKGKLMYFVWYCTAVGLFTIFYTNFLRA